MSSLLASPEELLADGWKGIAPHFQELASRPLDDIPAWLCDWSGLEDSLEEAGELAMIAYTTDTLDPAKEECLLRWTSQVRPRVEEQRILLSRRLAASGYHEPSLKVALRELHNQIELYRDVNLPLEATVSEMESRYQKLTGSMTIEWDGQTLTVPQVQARMVDSDRTVRERAYRLHLQPYADNREQLGEIFDQMLALRRQIAVNAGFDSYRDYAHRQKNRFDYSPDDCQRWHDTVEEVVVPAALRALDRRRQKMGMARLRPWDVEGSPDPNGLPPLRPFKDTEELSSGVGRIFERLDPHLARHYRKLVEQGLLDLDSRRGKAPGAYRADLPCRRSSFIFMNAAGIQDNVRTLLHESGHAFHSAESIHLPLCWQRAYGAEIAEVASMSMELLTAPHLAASEVGFYDEEGARRAQEEQLERILLFFGHCASVDALQHWIYTDPDGADRSARDRKWLELRDRFLPGVDYEGLDDLRIARWHAQLHIFIYPFYYIEYGLAQLGALQVWRNSRRDPVAALDGYRQALALGNTRSLPELFAAAGASLIFEPQPMRELITLVEEELQRLG